MNEHKYCVLLVVVFFAISIVYPVKETQSQALPQIVVRAVPKAMVVITTAVNDPKYISSSVVALIRQGIAGVGMIMRFFGILSEYGDGLEFPATFGANPEGPFLNPKLPPIGTSDHEFTPDVLPIAGEQSVMDQCRSLSGNFYCAGLSHWYTFPAPGGEEAIGLPYLPVEFAEYVDRKADASMYTLHPQYDPTKLDTRLLYCILNVGLTGNKACYSQVWEKLPNGEWWDATGVYAASYWQTFIRVRQGVECEIGYVQGEYGTGLGQCILVNARQAESDSKCDVEYSGGKLRVTDDVDCKASLQENDLVPLVRENGTYAYGRNEETGNLLLWQMTPGKETGTAQEQQWRLTEYEQIDAEHYRQTDIYMQSVETEDGQAGMITNVTENTMSGVISLPNVGTVSVLPPGAVQTPGNTPNVGTEPNPGDPGTNPQNPPTEWPSDYARQYEADAAANKINTKLDNIYKIESPPTDPVVPTSGEFQDAFFKDTFSGLLAWRLPAHQSVCPAAQINFTYFDHPFDIRMDAHCIIAEEHRGTLSVAMLVVWMLSGLFIVLRS